jgi:hypothetical protein
MFPLLSTSPALSHLLWSLTSLGLPHRNWYIADRHANKSSLCLWKPVCHEIVALGEEPVLDQHWKQNIYHGVVAELGFPEVGYCKRWFLERKTEWVRGAMGTCDCFLRRIVCVFRYPVLFEAGGVWERLCAAGVSVRLSSAASGLTTWLLHEVGPLDSRKGAGIDWCIRNKANSHTTECNASMKDIHHLRTQW